MSSSSSTPRLTDIRLIGPTPKFEIPPPALQIGALGVFFGGGQVWVDYPFATPPSADEQTSLPGTLSLAENVIRHSVAPALHGLSLARFKPLAALLNSLTHEVATTRYPKPPKQTAVSRRNLLTGRIGPLAQPPPEPIVTTHRQVIPPTVRYAVSLALLKAVAQTQHRLPARVLADEYGLPRPQKPPGLLAMFNASTTVDVESAHRHQPAAFGWRIAPTAGAAELGPQAETVQTRLREASDFFRSTTPPSYRPTILLNAQGRLGALCDDLVGKVLGMLYGMQYVTAPYPLIVCDPAIRKNLAAQIDWLKELKSYLRFRKIALTLAAGTHIRSAADIHTLADAGAADAVWLDAPAPGSLHQTMEMARAARHRGLQTLLAGTPSPPPADIVRLSLHIGLAAGIDYLVIPAESPSDLAQAQTGAARLRTEID